MDYFQQSSSIVPRQDQNINTFSPVIHINPLILKINQENFVKGALIILIISIVVLNNVQIGKLKFHFEQLENIHLELAKNVKNNHKLIQEQQQERVRVFQQIVADAKKQFREVKSDLQKFVEKILTEIHYSKRKITKLQNQLRSIIHVLPTNEHTTSKSQAANQTNNSNFPLSTVSVPKQLSKELNILQNNINFLLQQQKTQYHYKKMQYLRQLMPKQVKKKESFVTSFSNMKLKHGDVILSKQIQQNDVKLYERLSREYEFDRYKLELPFCLVVPTYNNAKNYRYLYNIQSITNLNYSNYKAFIIDDLSQDLTYQLLLQHLSQNPHLQNIHLLRNQRHMTALAGIDRAIRQHCDEQDIVVLVDGDDELLVKDSLKVFNAVYQRGEADVVYSNHLQLYWHKGQIRNGWSQSYTEDQITNNKYRQVVQKISHLRTFKAKLYLKIKPEDLKDDKGEWFTSTYDQVICLPILEMSCGRIVFLQEYFYLYNFGIGTNDLMVDATLQKSIADTVKFQRKKYKCLEKQSF